MPWRLLHLSMLGSGTSTYNGSLADSRIQFEQAQLSNTRERLASLKATVAKEEINVQTLRTEKEELESDFEIAKEDIAKLVAKSQKAKASYEEASTHVDELRDQARKTQRSLDKALKEIAASNDEIEKSASNRHAIYRRCRLEEIDLPLVSGSLDKVPLEEVSDICDKLTIGLR
jgi:structural maintenance of chromosome 1